MTHCVRKIGQAVAASVILAAGTTLWAEPLPTPTVSFESDSVVTLAETTSAPAPAAVAAPAAAPTDWTDQVKKPVSWFSWGADERLREEYYIDTFTISNKIPNGIWNYQRYRSRVWGNFTPIEQFEMYGRLTWEGRHFCLPDNKAEWDNSAGIIDNLYGRIKLPQIGTTVTLGRQDIILGDGWLVLEGTPLDGSRTIYFDAARGTIDLKPVQTTIDAIFIQQSYNASDYLPAINNITLPVIEQYERGAIFYATNKSVKNLQIDGYFIYKHDEAALINGDNSDLYTFGSRWAYDFNEHLRARVEGAGQFGSRNDANVCSYGINSRLSYGFNDNYKNILALSYEYLSGDNPHTATNEAFDPLWGRWPQWSELYVLAYTPETRIAETTNLQRIGPTWQVKPCEQIQIDMSYYALFANQNTDAGRLGFSDTGLFRGNLFQGVLRWKINRHVSGHFWAEYLIPGDYYTAPRGTDAVFLRAELNFTF